MLELDKKSIHAMEAMLTIAAHQGEELLNGKAIAAMHELPPRYLEQVMQKLVRAGLLKGLRGPKGGYVLAREKRKISLAEIMQALQENTDSAPEARYAALSDALEEAGNQLYHQLAQTTLQLLMQEEASSTSSEPKAMANFAI